MPKRIPLEDLSNRGCGSIILNKSTNHLEVFIYYDNDGWCGIPVHSMMTQFYRNNFKTLWFYIFGNEIKVRSSNRAFDAMEPTGYLTCEHFFAQLYYMFENKFWETLAI